MARELVRYKLNIAALSEARVSDQGQPEKELLFADDRAIKATSEGNMKRSMDLFTTACDNFDLVINTKKTVVMHQLPPNAACVAPQNQLEGA
nr:unnamed protein product [Spirometra erinaceieuropaei]